jgi:hypothetical protein
MARNRFSEAARVSAWTDERGRSGKRPPPHGGGYGKSVMKIVASLSPANTCFFEEKPLRANEKMCNHNPDR